MSQTSPVLALPLIQPSQAQKHVTHNEALRVLDAITQLTVLESTLVDPPVAPSVGDCYIIAPGPSGVWAGQGTKIGIYTGNDWQFFAPKPGWRADVTPTGETLRYDGAAWLTVDSGGSGGSTGGGSTGGGSTGGGGTVSFDNLPQVGVNTTADTTNRLSVASPATLLTHEGAGHQLKVNKAQAADTASLLFQTGYSGRAEMGTAGSDDFEIKVSDDGSSFATALACETGTGFVTAKKRFFAANLTSNLGGLADQADTVLIFDTVPQDDGGMYSTATGALTPPAGAISAVAGIYATNLRSDEICRIGIYKNGVPLIEKHQFVNGDGEVGMDVTLHDVCSGSDSYTVVYYLDVRASSEIESVASKTYFRGFHH